MNITTLSRPARALAGGTALLSALALPATAFAAGEVVGKNAGDGRGYNNVIDGNAANTHYVKIEDGDTVEVYCIDYATDYNETEGIEFKSTTRTAAGIPNLGKVASIVVGSGSIGTPLSDANSEVVAVQLAVWKLTNNTDYSKVNNTAIRDRATALLAGATERPEADSSANLTVTSEIKGTEVILTAKLATADGTPLADEEIDVTAPGKSETLTTDAAGEATLTVPAPKDAANATFTYQGVLPAGSILAPSSGQKVITTAPAKYTRNATAPVPAAPKAGSLADPTPAPVAPSTPEPTPEVLPYTGTWLQNWMILLAGAIGAGALALKLRNRTA